MRFNPPPGWPTPPAGWTPPPGWKPDPAWPAPPLGWHLFLPDDPLESSDPGGGPATPSTADSPGIPTHAPPGIVSAQAAVGPQADAPFQGVDPAPLLDE